jgi:prepilin-type processing-associated H-X9-DG protein
VLTCPSDTPNFGPITTTVNGAAYKITAHNYVANYGNTTNYQVDITAPANLKVLGAPFGWAPYQKKLTDIADGTSTTLLLSETVQGQDFDMRGLTWWAPAAQFTTALAPNSLSPDIVTENCVDRPLLNLPCVDNGNLWNMLAARSRHPGGVNAAMCDGSVRFVQQAIDIAIWRALSTAYGGETIGDF